MSLSVIAVLLLFIVLVALLAWLQTREIGHGFPWLRLFFPSWRFFEDFNQTPILMFRLKPIAKDFGQWTDCFPPQARRKVQTLFLNAEDLGRLAVQDLVDQLLREIYESSKGDRTPDHALIENGLSYRLVLNAVRFWIQSHKPQDNFELQFKVVLRENENNEDLFVSAVHQGGPA